MRKLTQPLLALLFGASLLGAGCSNSPNGPGAGPGVVDDDPLSDRDSLYANVPDPKSLPDESKADAVFPAKFTDLVRDQSPVKSQGSRGTCTIFATVALMENLYRLAGLEDADFSEQYLQWSTKFEVKRFTNTSGSNPQVNLEAISRFGIVKESAWPYEPYEWSTANDPACGGEESARPTRCFTNGEPPDAAKSADKFKLPAGRWISTRVRNLKDHLYNKKTAVVASGEFFYQAWNHGRSTLPVSSEYKRKGYVLAPSADDQTASRKQPAGHGFILVGWDDDLEVQALDKEGKPAVDAAGKPITQKGFFLFKNSWGTSSFGVENPLGAGYGWISYTYVEDYLTAYTSAVPDLSPPTPQPGTSTTKLESTTAAPIPDALTAGVSSTIESSLSGQAGDVQVCVDITHPYVGDLTISLTHGSTTTTLRARKGGSDDNVKECYPSTAFRNAPKSGSWILTVVDGAREDAGTLNGWSLTL
jgi:hypothetical protein